VLTFYYYFTRRRLLISVLDVMHCCLVGEWHHVLVDLFATCGEDC
jgi:hypothetical protein